MFIKSDEIHFLPFLGVSGEISSAYGYEAIYGAGGILQILAICYAFFFVKESKEIRAYNNIDSSVSSSDASTEGKASTKDVEKNLDEADEEKGSCCSIFR